VADPEHSVFQDYFESGDAALTSPRPSRIEGIGRPRVEPSFVRSVVDRMIKVPDAASFATLRFLEDLLGRKCGGSTGTNVYAALQIVSELAASGRSASVVSMICDGGERYLNTYFNDDWLAANGLDTAPWRARLDGFRDSGILRDG
jgi:cysteine synthase A